MPETVMNVDPFLIISLTVMIEHSLQQFALLFFFFFYIVEMLIPICQY